MRTIGLVFGGVTSESEISVITTCSAYKYLRQLPDYEIIPLYINKSGERFYVPIPDKRSRFSKKTCMFDGSIKDFEKKIASLTPIVIKPGWEKGCTIIMQNGWARRDTTVNIDILFPILHGVGGEDGTLQGLAEMVGVPVVGPDIFTASWTIDKIKTKWILRSNGFPVCDYRVLHKRSYTESDVDSLMSELGNKLVVKPYNGGSSIGVTNCSNRNELLNGITLAFSFGDQILIEPFLLGWREVCCAVASIDGTTTASLLEDPNVTGEIFSFDDKYKVNGGSFTSSTRTSIIPAQIKADISDKIRAICIDMFDKLSLRGTPRIDRLINESTGECVVIEVNAIPGNLAMHIWSASGVSPRILFKSLIDQSSNNIRISYQAGKTYATNILEDYAKLAGGKIHK